MYKKLREELDEAKDRIAELEDEVQSLQNEADHFESSMTDFSDEEVVDELLYRQNMRMAAVDKWKMEKFIENIQHFTLEQLEEFLTYVK